MNPSLSLHPSSLAPRRGFSLIELIVAMVIASTIFGLSVELLMLAKRETATGRERTMSAANLLRLGEQFRADVHAADTVSEAIKAGDRVLWTIEMPDDERVEYAPNADGLHRTEYRGDKVHARDVFVVPAAGVRLELKPAEKPVEAILLIKQGGSAAGDPESELRIEAAVGRDLRLIGK
jgi:prepilin-type N-terminal cleavage/methylation domain-containing protein